MRYGLAVLVEVEPPDRQGMAGVGRKQEVGQQLLEDQASERMGVVGMQHVAVQFVPNHTGVHIAYDGFAPIGQVAPALLLVLIARGQFVAPGQ